MAPSSSSSNNISQTITQLLKKTSHYDKDERYMATSDLCELLKKQQQQQQPPSITESPSYHHHNNNQNYHRNTGTSHASNTSNSFYYIDIKLEKEICTTVLRLLHDKSNDVQAIAVKTLGVLITTIYNTDIMVEISNSLLDQIIDETKLDLRDIYTAGLRTVIQTCDVTIGTPVTQTLIPRLLETLRIRRTTVTSSSSSSVPPTSSTSTAQYTPKQQQQMDEMIVSCCDVLMDCIVRFGTSSISMIQNHETILKVCLELLLSSSSSSSSSNTDYDNSNNSHANTTSSSTIMVRKRTGNVLACLATVLNDTLLHQLIEELLHPIEALQQQQQQQKSNNTHTDTGNVDMTRTLIRTMCSISGSVGQRFQQYHIDRIVPIFLPFTNPNHAITGDDNDAEEEDEGMTDGSTDDPDHSFVNHTGLVMNELREACFIGYTSFIVSCPNEMEHHLPNIIVAALAYMRYDPNYSYGNDNDNNNNNMEDNGDDDEDEYENEYDDDDNDDNDDDDDEDDDESWKVRRSAIRTIKAIIEMKQIHRATSNHNTTNQNTSNDSSHIASLWTNAYSTNRHRPNSTISQALMERFMEREENCRVDIMDCFTKLLSVTIQQVHVDDGDWGRPGRTSSSSGSSTTTHTIQFVSSHDNHGTGDDSAMAMETMDDSNTTIIPLATEYTPVLVKSCATILSKFKKTSGHGHNTNDRSKSAALTLLSTLCTVPGSGVGSYNEIQIITQQIQLLLGGGGDVTTPTTAAAVASSSSNNVSKALRLEALSLLYTMLASNTHNPADIRRCLTEPFVQQLCAVVLQEQWYKVIAEALRVMSQIPRYYVTVPPEETEASALTTFIAKELYVAIEPLLAAHDVDSEIKEGALRACAALLQYLPSHLTKDPTMRLLQLLYDRLTNETTRIAAMKAYAMIAESPPSAMTGSGCQLHSILYDSISTMASFLKLQNRGLKQSSLETLNVIISNHGQNATNPKELYPVVAQALAPLISDRDLHLCHLSL
jgi:cullin-associated NEDD8-dissociated protein 1